MSYPFEQIKKDFSSRSLGSSNRWWRRVRDALAGTGGSSDQTEAAFHLEALEPRVLLSADLSFAGASAADLTLAFNQQAAEFQLLDSTQQVVDTATAAGITNGALTIDGLTPGANVLRLDVASIKLFNQNTFTLTFNGDVNDSLFVSSDLDMTISGTGLTLDGMTFQLFGFEDLSLQGGGSANHFSVDGWAGTASIDGAGGSDTLTGPSADSTWNVTTANGGSVGSTSFSNIENLAGAAGNRDTFVLTGSGKIDGTINGGTGGNDSLEIHAGNVSAAHFVATGADSGTIDLDGIVTQYLGLEPVLVTGTITDAVIDLSSANDDARLLDNGLADGLIILDSLTGTFEDTTFSSPTGSLRINLGFGNDKLAVESLDAAFGASLKLDGNGVGFDLVVPDDEVFVTGDIALHGGSFEAIVGKQITIAADISTRAVDLADQSIADSGNITLTAPTITLSSGAALLAQADNGFTAGDVTLKAFQSSIVRTANTPAPAATITATNAVVKGDAIVMEANAAERFGVFGFKKDATSKVILTDTTINGNVVDIDAKSDTTLIPPAEATMSGNPALTFTHVPGGQDTITRASGSWLTDAFLPGHSITVSGTANNDGAYLIAFVTDTTITLAQGDFVADESNVPNVTVIGASIMPDPETLVDLLTPFTGSAVVTLSNAVAEAKVLGNSSITAVGAVMINSNAQSRATPFFPGLAIPKVIGIAAVWAQSTATAETAVDGTTAVTSGSLDMGADTDNTVSASDFTLTKNTPISLTFAGAKINGSTKAYIGAGATVNTGDVSVAAGAITDLLSTASVWNTGASGGGMAVALSLVETDTRAWIAGTVHATGDVSVTAATDTVNQITETDTRNLGGTGDLFTQLSNQVFQFGRDQAAPISALGKGFIDAGPLQYNPVESQINKLFPVIQSGKLNFAGAITYAQSDNIVRAYIDDGAHVDAEGGVEVNASMVARDNTTAAAEATSDGVAIGGAIAVANFTNNVKAYIGKGAHVDANNETNVTATFLNPFPWEIDFTSTEQLLDHLNQIVFGSATNLIFTSYVTNSSPGSKLGLAGSVDVRLGKNTAEAYIDEGAIINSNPNFGGADQSVNVYARNEVNGLHMVGTGVSWGFLTKLVTNKVAAGGQVDRINKLAQQSGITQKLKVDALPDPKAGIGGAVSFFDVDNAAIARIADGASVKAQGDVNVLADSEERVVVITQSKGTTDQLGIFGAGGIVFQNTSSIANIEDKANVTAGDDITVLATNDPRIYNITGGVAKGASIGIGASVGLNQIDAVTRANIGNGATMQGTPTLTFANVALTGVPNLRFENIELTGAPVLTFKDNAGSSGDKRDTITRASGDWAADGFKPGQMITIEGTADNDGTYQIAEVTATKITLADGEALANGTNETVTRREMTGTPDLTLTDNVGQPDPRDTITRSAGSWLADGFAAGQIFRLTGAGASDGIYKIAAVSATTLTLIASDRLTGGTATGAKVATVSVSAADVITRSSGSWLADGFRSGQTITVTGAGAANGTYLVDAVTDTEIRLDAQENLADVSANIGVGITAADTITRDSGSWLADGFKAGQTITIANAGVNSGAYEIAAVTNSVLTLVPAASLVNGTASTATVTDDPAAPTGVIVAGDNIDVQAVSGPHIVAVSLAGSIATQKDQAQATGSNAVDPAPGDVASAAGTGGKAGVGISGSVSLNFVNSSTVAQVEKLFSIQSNDLTAVANTAGAPKLSGSPTLNFASNGGQPDTITRTSGNWLADGFRAGQAISVSGTTLNNGVWRIASLTASTLTLTTEATLFNEVTNSSDNPAIVTGPAITGTPTLTFDAVVAAQDTIERSSGNWLADGFRPGMKIKVSGSALNNGEYELADVSATTLTLNGNFLVDTVQDEADAPNVVVTAVDDGKSLEIDAVAGAVTVSTQQGAGVGVAGSFTLNVVDGTTTAHLSNTDASVADDLVISARTPASILSIGASLSASTGSDKANLAGQVSYNSISNETKAFIDNATVTGTGPNVAVQAEDAADILSVAGAIAFGGKAGIGASVAINIVSNTTQAYILNSDLTAASVTVASLSSTSITAVTAAVGASSGQMAAEVAISVNLINNRTDAYIQGGKTAHGTVATGDITVKATDTAKIFSIAGGIAAAPNGAAGIGISLTFNRINDDTKASIIDATVNSTGGNVLVLASGDPTIQSYAVAGALADKFGLAGSFALNFIGESGNEDSVEATVEGSSTVTADGSVVLAADGKAAISTVAGALTVARGGALGVANTTAVTYRRVEARAGSGTSINARGARPSVTVLSGDRSNKVFNPTDDTATKGVVGYGTRPVDGLAISATSFDDYFTISVAGAVAAGASLSGSAPVNDLHSTVKAHIDDGAAINQSVANSAGQNVYVGAINRTTVDAGGGSLAYGNTAGIGLGAAVGVLNKETLAYVSRSANVGAGGNIEIKASSSEDIFSVSASAAGAATAAISGTAGVYVVNVTTKAYIGGGAATGAVIADGSVAVTADESTRVAGVAGNAAFGGTAGVGAGVIVPVINKTTYAFVDADANVAARGITDSLTVRDGSFAVNYQSFVGNLQAGEVRAPTTTNTQSTSGALSGHRIATPQTKTIRGLAVVATNQDDVEAIAVSGALAGAAAVSIAASVHVQTTDTQAYIGDRAKINQIVGAHGAQESVLVAASNDYFHLGVAGAAAGGGGVGVGPGVDVAKLTNTTKAYIGKSVQVSATGGDVEVIARGTEEILSIAAGLGVGGTVGVAGAVSVLVLDNVTNAFIDQGTVVSTFGNVLVAASDDTKADVIDGAAGVGVLAGGVGASVAVVDIKKDTRAYIDQNSVINGAGSPSATMTVFSGLNGSGGAATKVARGIAIQASSSEQVLAVAAAGAGGLNFGLAGGVTVSTIASNTQAYANNGSRLTSSGGSVEIAAYNKLKYTGAGGAAGIGLTAGLAGGVDVANLRNDTRAFIGGSAIINAASDVSVNALEIKDVDSYAVSAGGGLLGLAGAVSVYNIGADFSADGTAALTANSGGATLTGTVSGSIDMSKITSLLTSFKNGTSNNTASQQSAFDSATSQSSPPSSVAGNVTNQSNQTQLSNQISFAGSTITRASGSWVTDGFRRGQEITVSNSASNNGTFRVAAVTDTTLILEGVNVLTTEAVSARSILIKGYLPNGATKAYIGAKASVTAGDDVNVQAANQLDFNSTVGQGTLGLLSGGASVAVANIAEDTQAFIGGQATVAAGVDLGDDVVVTATLKETIRGGALSGSKQNFNLGLAAIGAQVVIVEENSRQLAYVDQGAKVTRADELDVIAKADRDAAVSAGGVQVGGLTIGAAIGRLTLAGSTSAFIGAAVDVVHTSSAVVTANWVNVAAENKSTALVDMFQAAGGVASGGGNDAYSKVTPNISAYLSRSTTTNAKFAVSVTAQSLDDSDAHAYGLNIGGFVVGISLAKAEAKPTLNAFVGRGAAVNAGTDVIIQAVRNYQVAIDPTNSTRLATDGTLTAQQRDGDVPNNGFYNNPEDQAGVPRNFGAYATAFSSSGSVLAGGSGATATADVSATLEAHTDVGSTIKAGGNIDLLTVSLNGAHARAMGVDFGGVVGAGEKRANSTSSTSSKTYQDGRVTQGVNLDVKSLGSDSANAVTNGIGASVVGAGTGGYATTTMNPSNLSRIGFQSFDPALAVDTVNDTIDLGYVHGFANGQAVVYDNGDPTNTANALGLPVDGGTKLVNTRSYYVITVPNAPTKIKLAYTLADAVQSRGAINLIAPVTGLGDQHSITTSAGTTYATVSGNVNVFSKGVSDGDSSADATAGAVGISVGITNSTTTVTPTVTALIGTKGTVTAGGNVTVQAEQGKTLQQGAVALSDGTFEMTNVSGNSITFKDGKPHGLVSGDKVIYGTGGGTALVGFADQRRLDVIKVNDTTIRLGDVISASAVDPTLDVISIPQGHSFKTGDQVFYDNGGGTSIGGLTSGSLYFVRVIDSTHIKLATTLAQATGAAARFDASAAGVIGADNQTFNVAGTGFANGDYVTYRAPTSSGFSVGQVDHTFALNGSGQLVGTYTPNARTIYLDNQNFTTGQAVTYSYGTGAGVTPIPELTNGGTYYVRVVDAHRIKLMATQADALADTNPIAMSSVDVPSGQQPSDTEQAKLSVTNTLTAVGNVTFNELQDGEGYYIVNAAANSFQLALTPGGTAITIGAHPVGSQSLGREGINLTSAPPSNSANGQIYLKLDTTGASGTQSLTKTVGGADIGAAGDGISTAYGSGTAIAVLGAGAEFTSTSTVNATVKAFIDKAAKVTANDVTVSVISNVNASATESATSGALVAVGDTAATTNLNNNSKAYLGASAIITARANFNLTAVSNQQTNMYASAYLGAGIPIGSSAVTANVGYGNFVSVGDKAVVTAANNLTVDAKSRTSAGISAYTDGRGLGGRSDATASLNETNAVTRTQIGKSSGLNGKVVSLSAYTDKMDLTVKTDSLIYGFAGDTHPTSGINVQPTAEVILGAKAAIAGPSATVTRADSVDITALNRNISSNNQAYGYAGAAFSGTYPTTNTTFIPSASLTALTGADAASIKATTKTHTVGGNAYTLLIAKSTRSYAFIDFGGEYYGGAGYVGQSATDQYGNIVQLMQAAGAAPVATRVGAPSLTRAELDSIVSAAIGNWEKTGDLTKAQKDALRAVKFEIADLDGSALGATSADTVYIDINGAGFGWFVDKTPWASEEFKPLDGQNLKATFGSLAYGRMDLLTVVRHELGHVLGLSDEASGPDAGIMDENLGAGERIALTGKGASGDGSVRVFDDLLGAFAARQGDDDFVRISSDQSAPSGSSRIAWGKAANRKS